MSPMSPALDPPALEARTQAIGRELFDCARGAGGRLNPLNQWAREVLGWCMSDPKLKAQVLRFVDVLPSLQSFRAVAKHVAEYFPTDQFRLPAPLRAGSALSRRGLMTAPAVAIIVRQLVEQAARQFIAGANPEDAVALLQRLSARQAMASFDLLGEQVLSEQEAEQYARRYLALLEHLGQRAPGAPGVAGAASGSGSGGAGVGIVGAARGDGGRPTLNVSIKPSGLTAKCDPLDEAGTLARWLERLAPIAAEARRAGASLTLDMEQYALRDLTLELARRLLTKHPDLSLGVVIQAYLRDSEAAVDDLLAWLRPRRASIAVRLVKGAYWDSEVAHATQQGWEPPVYLEKWQSDQAFERLTVKLLHEEGTVHLAVASHNLRSIAHAMAAAEALEVPKARVEFQLLYGMAATIQHAIGELGWPVRVYTPLGELIPGMAYLVRRILENTANESFLRHDLLQDASAEELLRPPAPLASHGATVVVQTPEPDWPVEPMRDFARREPRDRFTEALAAARAEGDVLHPAFLGDGPVRAGQTLVSRNPANPTEVLGHITQAGAVDVDRAVQLARTAQPAWARRPVVERANTLRRVAELMRGRRDELAARVVLEVGKTWREADADVVESVDYLEYYAWRMEALAAGSPLLQVPGERNLYQYTPRGVAAVIAPWNFPAAILTGMTAAALVAGNAVILKPAEQASLVGILVVELFRDGGVPPGVLQCLPGFGPDVGAGLVEHPGTQMVLFTGSKTVGLSILEAASRIRMGQRFVKQVVLELGGKNAIIVDDDADLDAAVAGTLSSAFSYQGQKCSAASRVLVHAAVFDRFIERLSAATDRLVVGDPSDPATDLGPLIEEDARERLRVAMEQAGEAGTVVYDYPAERLPEQGYFVGPMIVADLPPTHRLATEELFGPLLCAFRVDSFWQALEQANATEYGLTGGVYSRSPSHIRRATEAFEVGNLYINRPITGALVGRQPFGGMKLSGLGTKAGGPDYLLSAMIPKTICENTARHGVPLEA
jgi:RHH-type proline utilization regulon transcriptional repressor/proline dehydrogenase/delta 1-pyrroline-5-carboxylate dehydrogenase